MHEKLNTFNTLRHFIFSLACPGKNTKRNRGEVIAYRHMVTSSFRSSLKANTRRGLSTSAINMSVKNVTAVKQKSLRSQGSCKTNSTPMAKSRNRFSSSSIPQRRRQVRPTAFEVELACDAYSESQWSTGSEANSFVYDDEGSTPPS